MFFNDHVKKHLYPEGPLRKMGGIKDPNDPQILPKGAYRNALSIKGGIPFFEHCEHSAKARGIMLGKIKPYCRFVH